MTKQELDQKIMNKAHNIREHERTKTARVLEVVDGCIRTVALVCTQYPPKGHADRPLRVAVYSYHRDGHLEGITVGEAGGYGYDKRTAALQGCVIRGFSLGNHCDRLHRDRLENLCEKQGWTLVGNSD